MSALAAVTITEDAYGLAAVLAERPEWRRHGLCVGVDPELFFPTRGDSSGEAKAICARCSVREQCLDYALSGSGERFGVWGGTSERERRLMRRDRNRAARLG